jgi:hypothetical protein
MKIEIHYELGHPEGYTNDLGIISDTDHWVKERLPGWYSTIYNSQGLGIHEWCLKNLHHGYWKLAVGIYNSELYIGNEKDVMLFSLRWL